LRNNPAYSYKWIATGGYMLGASTNHFCDVIWGYDKSGSVCCIVSDSTCTDTLCVTSTINNAPTGGIAGDDIETPTMSVKPNPAADMIDISTALGEQFARYELIDVTGIVVQRTEGISTRMSVADVAPGVYHVVQRDRSGNVIGMQRVVVKR
ncbi:MAG: T9SS type A sorting domain-containing protein, partial [Ignavibacteria bacterium]